jgi:hypothetical protein
MHTYITLITSTQSLPILTTGQNFLHLRQSPEHTVMPCALAAHASAAPNQHSNTPPHACGETLSLHILLRAFLGLAFLIVDNGDTSQLLCLVIFFLILRRHLCEDEPDGTASGSHRRRAQRRYRSQYMAGHIGCSRFKGSR